MMTYLIWTLIILAALHFIYSGIILPSIRFSLRSQLFKLRDQLRSLKINQGSAISDDAFIYLQEAINNGINILPRIDLPTLTLAERGIKDKETLRRQAEERMEAIHGCSAPEIQEIRKAMGHIFMKALLANSVPLFFYLLPLLCVVTAITPIIQKIKVVTSVPEREIDSVLPFDPMAAR